MQSRFALVIRWRNRQYQIIERPVLCTPSRIEPTTLCAIAGRFKLNKIEKMIAGRASLSPPSKRASP
jgi:hypothetical protein